MSRKRFLKRGLGVAGVLGLASAAGVSKSGPFATADALAISNGAYDFFVSSYGAVGDGSTDDTTAVQNCINAAVSYAGSHNGFARVVFDDKTYAIKGSMVSTAGVLSQLLIPQRTTGPMITIEIIGAGTAASLQNFNSTPLQGSGTVLQSFSTATYSGTGPSPSIFAVAAGSDWGTFNRTKVVIRDIGIRAPSNPSIAGLWLINAPQVEVTRVRIDTTDGINNLAQPTNPAADAIVLPAVNNNVLVYLNQVGIEAWYCGVKFGEHTNVDCLLVHRCYVGLAPMGNNYHLSYMGHVVLDQCPYGISASYATIGVTTLPSGSYEYFAIDGLDIEDANDGSWAVPVYHVNDPNNTFHGRLQYVRVKSAVGTQHGPLTVNGATGLTYVDLT